MQSWFPVIIFHHVQFVTHLQKNPGDDIVRVYKHCVFYLIHDLCYVPQPK